MKIIKEKFELYDNWHNKISQELNNLGNIEEKELTKIFTEIFNIFITKSEELSELTSKLTEDEKNNFKKIIRNSKISYLMKQAPLFHQIIYKPRGYAGDAEVMNYMYENKFRGETNFGKIWHKIAASVTTAETVRYRKQLLLHELKNKVKNGDKIMSLAAGPAVEIKEYLSETTKVESSFLALDHDIETVQNSIKNYSNKKLQYGISNAFNIIAGNYKVLKPREYFLDSCNPKKDLKGINKITSPVKYKIIDIKKSKFDYIYSAGLFDYIKTYKEHNKGTIALTKNLFSLVANNGNLLIGNFSRNSPDWIRWHMEYICDWNLIYRDENEILNFINSIPKNQINSVEIIKEKTGINNFILINKN